MDQKVCALDMCRA